MPVNYDFIRKDNLRKYGEEIERIGDMLLANRYDDPNHFIFELLQNAEDALKKRGQWDGSRSVKFSVDSNALMLSHSGKPFDEADVHGVCGIGESTKELTDIGRFGIGFKSVYAFTDRPEIHSGQEHFAIESYVWPKAVEELDIPQEETQIIIPFRENSISSEEEVIQGLRRLGPRTLLFLREIEEISWSVADGPSGKYWRSISDVPHDGVRKVVVGGSDDASGEVVEEWIVFSREVHSNGKAVGHVEIAFALDQDNMEDESVSVYPTEDSRLVVFFPTVLSTHLGFIIQGPYRTTPSRDNVPMRDTWNWHLVKETTGLLVDALKELRDLDLLDVSAIQCLPLDESKFTENSMFAPIFQEVKEALTTESLLPAYGGGHIAGENAKLARTRALRALISPEQLTHLFSSDNELVWLSDEITADRTPELYKYITAELDIDEITPERLIDHLTIEFLESQSDEWIQKLYVFLNGQRSELIKIKLREIPLVRLTDGSHTVASYDRLYPLAYLPSDQPTEFSTVNSNVCQSDDAWEFLESLGLRTPDPVDDVIDNVLPKYTGDQVDVLEDEYQSDIERVIAAHSTDSYTQRIKLESRLQESKFVVAVDTGNGQTQFVRPGDAYMATERLKSLFSGVPDVLIVDSSRDYLRGEDMRNVLRAVQTPVNLVLSEVEPSLTDKCKQELRRQEQWGNITREVSVKDYTLRGLTPLLNIMTTLSEEQASERSELLWQCLRDLPNYAFSGKYRWFYYHKRSAAFPAHFIKQLNEAVWVPGNDGKLHSPSSVVFSDTGWEPDLSLFERIHFKPDTLEVLAKETGFDPEALDLLKKRGYTSVDKLRELGIFDNTVEDSDDISAEDDSDQTNHHPSGDGVKTRDNKDSSRESDKVAPSGQQTGHDDSVPDTKSNDTGNGKKFISYVAVSPTESTGDSDGLGHEQNMALEEKAITKILSEEPKLSRTPTNNPGFDLEEIRDGATVRWVEVKSMTGTLQDHPVGISSTQFKFAEKHKDAYWLYVVERAGDLDQSRIIRIKDPAGKAQTFTFDHGWVEVSENPN